MHKSILLIAISIYIHYRINDKLNGGTGFIGCLSNQNNLVVLVTCSRVLPSVAVAEQASFTFGYKDETDQPGTTVIGNDLLDVKQWFTDPCIRILHNQVKNLVNLIY